MVSNASNAGGFNNIVAALGLPPLISLHGLPSSMHSLLFLESCTQQLLHESRDDEGAEHMETSSIASVK
eukprot:15339295-Ditylum_brightwellii.AAC.1